MFEFALFLIFPAAMAFAGCMDLFTMTIPNRITLVLIAAFIVVAPFAPMTWGSFASHLGAGLLMLAVGIAMFSFRLLGGGDAKLMAAAGLWFGTEQTMFFLIITSFAGFFLAAGVSAWSAFMVMWEIHAADNNPGINVQLKKFKPKLPYGFAFAVGAILAFPHTWWMGVS